MKRAPATAVLLDDSGALVYLPSHRLPTEIPALWKDEPMHSNNVRRGSFYISKWKMSIPKFKINMLNSLFNMTVDSALIPSPLSHQCKRSRKMGVSNP